MTLNEYLTASGLSQAAFARLVECPQPLVNYWLRGRNKPSHRNMVRISEATGGTVTWNDFMPKTMPQDANAGVE
jgi:DNA-binding transcriptional regulator YdaS (Cro superfamily)